MSVLKFSDGININTSGELRIMFLSDGGYVVGEGKLIPISNIEEGKEIIKSLKNL